MGIPSATIRRMDQAVAEGPESLMTDLPPLPRRDTWLAIRRGLMLRCPACGRGKILAGYLRPAQVCSSCSESLGEYRADDGPAWATILLVGHLVSPAFFLFATTDTSAAFNGFLFIAALVLALTFVLLPRMKGLFVGIMWSSRAGDVSPS